MEPKRRIVLPLKMWSVSCIGLINALNAHHELATREELFETDSSKEGR